MPIYKYECSACRFRFEVKEGFDQEPVAACPKCKGKAYRLFTLPEIRVKDKWKSRE